MPKNTSLLDEAICGRSRTGKICGDCRIGYTTHFHSPNFFCKSVQDHTCRIGWFFYVFSELLPVSVVFLTVLALNINFTSGNVNGFILFSQLINSLSIDAGGQIQLSHSVRAFIHGYKVIYGFFNLEYFNIESLSFCLWSNASALDMIAFKYVTVVYALFLIVFVVLFMNKCGGRCLGKWCRVTKLNASVTHGITTFLVMCYTQCLNVSFTLLFRYEYDLQVDSGIMTSGVVWLNGNLSYFRGKHLLYAVPALICMLTIGIFPLFFLLIYPLLCKLIAVLGFDDSKAITFISNNLPICILKPLLDSFQGCFKDNLRFFAGLYFVYRFISLSVYAFSSSYINFYTVMEILLLLMLALHSSCQPYAKKVQNVIDTLLFTNLAIINAISFANYYRAVNYGEKFYTLNNASAIIMLMLIYFPVLIFTIYVIVKVLKCYLRYQYQNKLDFMERSLNTSLCFCSKVQDTQLRTINSSSTGANYYSEDELCDEMITSDNQYRRMC